MRYRLKVLQLIEARPESSLDYLWVKAYQPTFWLTTNDRAWLMDKLTPRPQKKETPSSLLDKRDQEYAEIIRKGAQDLYTISGKQVRVNKSNMLALLPKRIIGGSKERRAAFPLVTQQLELNFESLWHFRLRRAIWALFEMGRLKLPPNTCNLAILTSLPRLAWQALVNYCEWELEKIMSEGINTEVLLGKANVSRQWEGPPGYHLPMGGRSYVSNKRDKYPN
jgi:hypothetical protein